MYRAKKDGPALLGWKHPWEHWGNNSGALASRSFEVSEPVGACIGLGENSFIRGLPLNQSKGLWGVIGELATTEGQKRIIAYTFDSKLASGQ